MVSASLARPAEYLRKRAFEIKDRLLGGKAMPWGMEFFLVSLQVRQALGEVAYGHHFIMNYHVSILLANLFHSFYSGSQTSC